MKKALYADVISSEELKQMSNGFISMGENLKKISDGINTFHEKSGMFIAYFPHNQKELDNILYGDGVLRDIFSETIIDNNHLLMMIKLEGNLEDTTIDSIFEDLKYAMEKEDLNLSYIISGKPVLDSSLRGEMKSNMLIMVASTLVLMLIILNLVFRVRWRALSLGIIFVSVIASLGLMGHLNVSMAVFPILIGLGIDYSIQFQKRYEEEGSVKITLLQIGKAVGLAVLATVLGFVSLFASPVPIIQDFGKMLTIGVLVSFVGSVFLLMPILDARDTVATKARTFHIKDYEKATSIDRFLKFTVDSVVKLAPMILIISIALSGLVFLALLTLYRSFFKAMVAIFPVLLIVGMSGGIMNLLGLKYTPITATLGALVLGMGTEMTIMLLERYLEERQLGKEKKKALFTTIKYIGKATLASGLTTVGGFSVLMTSKFIILKDFGLMTVINISLAIMASFVILPALIWIFDGFIVKESKEVNRRVIQE